MNGWLGAISQLACRPPPSRGMGAEHLLVEALACGPEAANSARVGVQRPDRCPQDSVGRGRREQAEALIGRIGHVR